MLYRTANRRRSFRVVYAAASLLLLLSVSGCKMLQGGTAFDELAVQGEMDGASAMAWHPKERVFMGGGQGALRATATGTLAVLFPAVTGTPTRVDIEGGKVWIIDRESGYEVKLDIPPDGRIVVPARFIYAFNQIGTLWQLEVDPATGWLCVHTVGGWTAVFDGLVPGQLPPPQ
jgi:hypothetical protein